jgi:hypothetical protein
MTVLQFRPRNPRPSPPEMTTTFTDPLTFVRRMAFITLSFYLAPWVGWLDILNDDRPAIHPRNRA